VVFELRNAGCSGALRREQGYSDEQEAVLDIAFSFKIYTLLLPIYTHNLSPYSYSVVRAKIAFK